MNARLRHRLGPRLGPCAGIVRWLRTRKDPPGEGEFTYHRGPEAALVVWVALTFVEAVVIHVVLQAIFGPTWWVLAILVADLYGPVWILGRFYACMAVLPHVVRRDDVLLRCGTIADLVIPRDAVLRVRRVRRGRSTGPGKLAIDTPGHGSSAVAEFSNSGADIAIDVEPTATLLFKGEPLTTPIGTVYVSADDPDGFAAFLGAGTSASRGGFL